MNALRDLSVWQAEVVEWNRRNFGDDKTAPIDTLVVVEESSEVVDALIGLILTRHVGRLSRAVLKQEQRIRGTAEEWDAEIAKEIGDVIITLASLAANRGLDLGQTVADRWAVVGARDFTVDRIGHGMPVTP